MHFTRKSRAKPKKCLPVFMKICHMGLLVVPKKKCSIDDFAQNAHTGLKNSKESEFRKTSRGRRRYRVALAIFHIFCPKNHHFFAFHT